MLDGYVYILIHPAMPDLVKVGKTIRTAEVRARELSRRTGVPGPYRVAYDEHFHDVIRAERATLRKLEQRKAALAHEHFRISLKKAISALREVKEEFHQQGELFTRHHLAGAQHEIRKMVQQFERACYEKKIEEREMEVLRGKLQRAADAMKLDYHEVRAALPSNGTDSSPLA